MKNNLIVGVLVGLICVGAVVSMIYSVRFIIASRELNGHQAKILMINNDRNAAQNLLQELTVYSEAHPAVTALLIQIGAKTNQSVRPSNR